MILELLTPFVAVYLGIALLTSFLTVGQLYPTEQATPRDGFLTVVVIGLTWPLFWTWKLAYSGEKQ